MKQVVEQAVMKGGIFVAGLILGGWCLLAQAASLSPVGYWKTIDDRTGKPKSIVQIEDVNGVLQGKIIKTLMQPGAAKPMEFCTKCTGERLNKPIVGMTVLWGLTAYKNPNVWSGGKILDPKTGEIYSCKITLSPEGQKLEVRGYLGISMLGRSQTWLRLSDVQN